MKKKYILPTLSIHKLGTINGVANDGQAVITSDGWNGDGMARQNNSNTENTTPGTNKNNVWSEW